MKFYTEQEIRESQFEGKLREMIKTIKPQQYFKLNDLIKECDYTPGGPALRKTKAILSEMGFRVEKISGRGGGLVTIAWKDK